MNQAGKRRLDLLSWVILVSGTVFSCLMALAPIAGAIVLIWRGHWGWAALAFFAGEAVVCPIMAGLLFGPGRFLIQRLEHVEEEGDAAAE